MTGLIDLHVLRRVTVLSGERKRVSINALADDCASVTAPIGRARCMEAEGLLRITQRRGVEYLAVTEAGLVALAAEPTHYRDKPGFTNR